MDEIALCMARPWPAASRLQSPGTPTRGTHCEKEGQEGKRQEAEGRRPGRGTGDCRRKEAGREQAWGRREAEAARSTRRSSRRLHVELVKLQEWVKHKGLKVCIVFEGRDGAGKGGTIKAITERVSPRVFRVIALPAPTEREKSQMYVQRYLPHLPAAGEVVIFDRSWYNRAGVERVMGFCTEERRSKAS